jgi:hypothetical protein
MLSFVTDGLDFLSAIAIFIIIISIVTLYILDNSGNRICDKSDYEYSDIQDKVDPDYVKCIEVVYDNVTHKEVNRIEHILKRWNKK